jgi:alanyl-tRNA synthetase
MKTDELREMFLTFFEGKGHTRCSSDVLVPTWDPSVLFTPAGMNQFKDHFLGKVKLDFTRATTCQKCLRTGDIENVGRTAYHHTFFEMLGNFSFGDYFKRDAIHWAWEFLTDKKWLAIDPARLSVSVYVDDDEAAGVWTDDIGLSVGIIERLGEYDNFWPAGAPSDGPDGVCGPCSEIFYHDNFGQVVEIWNLVFTQFNRVGDPPDNLRPLPSKNIDTGMGLERAAACLQGVPTNYHIDTLRGIVDEAATVCGLTYEADSDAGRRLRRITDHVRACTMAIHENVYPGAQKEKYVIRRLLRRAVLDGHQLGLREAFLYQLVPVVVDAIKVAYPEIVGTIERVQSVVKNEEANFFGTIDAGLARIERIFAAMDRSSRTTVDGREAADLYQTYGVPPEVFETMAAEHNLAFDWDGYHTAMEEHGEVSGKVAHTVMGDRGPIDAVKKVLHEVPFLGYEATEADVEVKFIVAGEQLREKLSGGDPSSASGVILVLDQSPFYGESGGQVGDTGEIVGDNFRFDVEDTQKEGGLILHQGRLVTGELATGSRGVARVSTERRDAVRRAHSATHILHFALQKSLGSHAQQQGSKVDEDWLRFDFTNMAPVDGGQLKSIESEVNARVDAAEPITAAVLPLADAREQGAMMLFGEKYPDPVRMVTMGQFSRELCGGTHLNNTSDVGAIEILSEEGVSAGTRRVVAVTGTKAKDQAALTRQILDETTAILSVPEREVGAAVRDLAQVVRDLKKQIASGSQASAVAEQTAPTPTADRGSMPYAEIKESMQGAARLLNVSPPDVPARVAALKAEVENLKQQIENLAKSGSLSADSMLQSADDIAGTRIVIAETPGANPQVMRQLVDQIRKKADSSSVFLAAAVGNAKVVLVAGLSRDLVDRGLSAGEWVRQVAPIVGGGGGGKPDLAQAGGKQPDKLPEALRSARSVLEKMLSG